MERRKVTKKSTWRYPIEHLDRTPISREARAACLTDGELMKRFGEEDTAAVEKKRKKERAKREKAPRTQKKNQDVAARK